MIVYRTAFPEKKRRRDKKPKAAAFVEPKRSFRSVEARKPDSASVVFHLRISSTSLVRTCWMGWYTFCLCVGVPPERKADATCIEHTGGSFCTHGYDCLQGGKSRLHAQRLLPMFWRRSRISSETTPPNGVKLGTSSGCALTSVS